MGLNKFVFFIVLMLQGCAHDDAFLPKLQLIPEQDSVQQIKNIKISYILSNKMVQTPGTINGLIFPEYSQGRPTKMERLYIKNKGDALQIERRTDNGVAGSGLIYDVAMSLVPTSEGAKITLIPKTQKSYQQGLVLPFPIPTFNIEAYLATASIDYEFEMDSTYPASSIKASFDRLMTRNSNGTYRLSSTDEDFDIAIQIDPYKHNQSKVLISCRLYNKKSQNGIINVVKKIDSLKRRIRGVINS